MKTVELLIIVVTIQALLYGLYVATLAHCLRWLLYDDGGWSHRKDIRWPMVAVTVVIFLFFTAILVMDLRGVVAATVLGVAPGVLAPYAALGTAGYALDLALILTTDAVLIYRCWVLYSNSWRIIFLPFTIWLGGIVCMALIIYLFMFSDPSHLQMRHTCWEAFYSCNISINIYATTAMVYRILSAAKGTNGIQGRLYFKICRILSESGILFALSSLTNLMALILDTNPNVANLPRGLFNAINVSMAGIAFNLILIRVGQERTNPRNIQGYSQNTGPLPSLQFNSPAVAPSQAQTCDTACTERKDRVGLDTMEKAECE